MGLVSSVESLETITGVGNIYDTKPKQCIMSPISDIYHTLYNCLNDLIPPDIPGNCMEIIPLVPLFVKRLTDVKLMNLNPSKPSAILLLRQWHPGTDDSQVRPEGRWIFSRQDPIGWLCSTNIWLHFEPQKLGGLYIVVSAVATGVFSGSMLVFWGCTLHGTNILPTFGKGKTTSILPFAGDMLVPRRVVEHQKKYAKHLRSQIPWSIKWERIDQKNPPFMKVDIPFPWMVRELDHFPRNKHLNNIWNHNLGLGRKEYASKRLGIHVEIQGG